MIPPVCPRHLICTTQPPASAPAGASSPQQQHPPTAAEWAGSRCRAHLVSVSSQAVTKPVAVATRMRAAPFRRGCGSARTKARCTAGRAPPSSGSWSTAESVTRTFRLVTSWHFGSLVFVPPAFLRQKHSTRSVSRCTWSPEAAHLNRSTKLCPSPPPSQSQACGVARWRTALLSKQEVQQSRWGGRTPSGTFHTEASVL